MMNVKLVALSCLVLAALAPSAAAQGTAPDAQVESLATVVVYEPPGTGLTNFDIDVYNCPEGVAITITWEADQPEPPEGPGTHAGGVWVVNFSTGERIQHFTLSAIGGFLPGYRWTGKGDVTCGTVVIPVTGSGMTVGTNGL